jgi:hypothetical protein
VNGDQRIVVVFWAMRISCLVASLIATFAVLVLSQAAPAGLLARIDKSAQRSTVNGQQLYEWPVSTGGSGYDTQNGTFKPFRMEIDHHSEEWDEAPVLMSRMHPRYLLATQSRLMWCRRAAYRVKSEAEKMAVRPWC